MGWTMRGRLVGLVLLSLSFITANTGYSVGPARAGAGDSTLDLDERFNRMNAARSAAQRHLNKLYALVRDEKRAAYIDAGVKVAVLAGDGAQAVIWVRPLGWQDGKFFGHLTEVSTRVEGHKVGDVVGFEEAQVRDWYFYGPSGKMFGAFATRAMLGEVPADTAARINTILSDKALPANW